MAKLPGLFREEGPPAPSAVRRPFLARPTTLWGAAALLLAAAFVLDRPGLVNGYYLSIMEVMGIFAILSMSLGFINGFTGQFSLGHATFMGVGAYTSALLTSRLSDWPFLPALILGGIVAGLFALLLGIPVFKLKGDYVCVITLALNLIFTNLLWNFSYAGGPSGLPGILPDANLTWIVLWAIITYAVLRNLVFSTHGRAILAIREDEVAAPLVGIDAYRYKIISFSIACFFAGIAGGLYAHTLSFIAPQGFTFFVSIDILAMSLLGGTGSLAGAALGAIALRFTFEALRFMDVWRLVLAPIVLIIIMIFRPSGLYGLKEPWFLQDHWDNEPLRDLKPIAEAEKEGALDTAS